MSEGVKATKVIRKKKIGQRIRRKYLSAEFQQAFSTSILILGILANKCARSKPQYYTPGLLFAVKFEASQCRRLDSTHVSCSGRIISKCRPKNRLPLHFSMFSAVHTDRQTLCLAPIDFFFLPVYFRLACCKLIYLRPIFVHS
jgi:hypothetical protein